MPEATALSTSFARGLSGGKLLRMPAACAPPKTAQPMRKPGGVSKASPALTLTEKMPSGASFL
eukprot:11895058-Alexandrium_andersonii.AAC.1